MRSSFAYGHRIFAFLVSVGITAGAHASALNVRTSVDTHVNYTAANVNKAIGSGTQAHAQNGANSAWFKFSAADFPADVVGSSMTSLSLQFFQTVVNSNSTINFFFNSNSTWQENVGFPNGSVVDSATTPFLTYNNAGLSGPPASTNSRFNTDSVLIGSVSYGSNAGVQNTTQQISLNLVPALVGAITSGSSFTIYAFSDSIPNSRVTFLTLEGVGNAALPASADAMRLIGTYTPVPAPTIAAGGSLFCLLGSTRRARRQKCFG